MFIIVTKTTITLSMLLKMRHALALTTRDDTSCILQYNLTVTSTLHKIIACATWKSCKLLETQVGSTWLLSGILTETQVVLRHVRNNLHKDCKRFNCCKITLSLRYTINYFEMHNINALSNIRNILIWNAHWMINQACIEFWLTLK